MIIRIFLIFTVMLSAMRLGPVLYNGLTCVEPELGYGQQFLHIFSSHVAKICPTSEELALRVGKEMFITYLSILLTLLLSFLPSAVKVARSRLITLHSWIHEWRNPSTFCSHCGTDPCQVKRRSLWKPSGSRVREEANYAKRANAMWLFNCGLDVSILLTKELPQDEVFWKRRFCQPFREEHMKLFPLCIQKEIDFWYPLSRYVSNTGGWLTINLRGS